MTAAQLGYGKRMAEPGVRVQTQKGGGLERNDGRLGGERERARDSQPAAAAD